MVLGGGAGPADKPRPRVLSFASAVRVDNNGSWQPGSHKVVERVDAAEEEVECGGHGVQLVESLLLNA